MHLHRENNPLFKGIGKILGGFICRIKKSAEFRKIIYNLSNTYLWDLFLQQNRKCALSGVELYFSSKSDSSDGIASLDRIDSSKGYIKGNVQWIHKDIQQIKWNKDEKDFKLWIKLIYENLLLQNFN